jgi:hypothetical protein
VRQVRRDGVLAQSRRGERFHQNISHFRDRILLRSQEISNHPEVIRHLGVIATNGMIEAGIYGNVNSGPDPQPRGARVRRRGHLPVDRARARVHRVTGHGPVSPRTRDVPGGAPS